MRVEPARSAGETERDEALETRENCSLSVVLIVTLPTMGFDRKG